MVAVSEPFYGFSIIIEGMMQGVGKTKEPFVFNIAGMWGIRIVGTFLCTQLLSLSLISAWACMIAHNLFLFAIFLFCYVKGVWNPVPPKAAALTRYHKNLPHTYHQSPVIREPVQRSQGVHSP